MKRALVIIALVAIVVGVAVGQCPHAFFKAHDIRGVTTCESRGCTYATKMASLVPCALNEARYQMSVKFPGRDVQWAETPGPETFKFVDGIFIGPGFGPVYGLTQFMQDGTFVTTVALIGDVDEDFDTMIHEACHSMAARVLTDKMVAEKFHNELDNGSHTEWYRARYAN